MKSASSLALLAAGSATGLDRVYAKPSTNTDMLNKVAKGEPSASSIPIEPRRLGGLDVSAIGLGCTWLRHWNCQTKRRSTRPISSTTICNKQVINMNKIILISAFSFLTLNVMAQKKIVQTAGRTQLGDFAPKFAQLNDDVLFGEVWSRNDKLSLRDRSMVTVTSLISQGITDSSLTFHLQEAKKNGITRMEIAEILTHMSFYAGWPKAWAAFRLAKDVWADDAPQTSAEDAKAAFQREMIFPIGQPNTAYAKYFIGNSYLARLSSEQVSIANVTFEPRCRNNGTYTRPPKAEARC